MTTAEPRPHTTRDGASGAGRDAALLAAAAASVNRLNRLGTIESIGRAIVEETRRVIDYHNCRVYLLEPPERLVPIAFGGSVGTYDDIPLELLETTLGVGFTGWAAATGEALLVPDANADPRGATIPGTDDVEESMICAPMRLDDATIGVVTLSKLGLGQFDDADVQLMTILADAAATAIGTARALDQAGRQQARLRSLLNMSSELSQTLDPLAVADRIAEHMARATGVEECAISYWDRPWGRVLSWGYYPPAKREQVGPEYDLSHFPLTERVLRDRVAATIDVDDPAADPAEVGLLREFHQSALTMIPLVAKGEAIGLVELISLVPRQLDGEQIELAWAMANEAAMALSNARLYEAARNQADRDPLTDFYNHRYLQERLAEELLRSRRTGAPLALLMLDLDDFKPVNDTLGHQVGDDVLRWTAEQIRATLRATDVPARYGGDEFAVILPDTDVETARAAAERILAVFRDSPFRLRGGSQVPIGVSIGIAGRPPDGPLAAELIGAADRALYRAKRAGGGGLATSADTDTPEAVVPAPFDAMENVTG
jgi:diguanylate cyclase (GGDEF)-like protein